MAGFTINSVEYGNAPAGLQNFTFEYKLFSASSWINISGSSAVNTDGTLAVPLPVTGLTAGQLYYIRGSANCNSPREYFIQQVQL
jgi:hypothetical protein